MLSIARIIFNGGKDHPLILVYSIWAILMPIIVASTVVYQLQRYYFFFLNLHWLDLVVVYCGFALLLTFACVHASFLAALGGFLFGWYSLIYLLPAYILAQTIGWYLSKLADRGALIQIMQNHSKLASYTHVTLNKVGLFIFLIRLTPAIPFALSNVVLGITGARLKDVTIFGVLGMLPRTILFVAIGKSVRQIAELQTTSPDTILPTIILIMISIVGLIWLYWKPQKSEHSF